MKTIIKMILDIIWCLLAFLLTIIVAWQQDLALTIFWGMATLLIIGTSIAKYARGINWTINLNFISGKSNGTK